MCIRDSERAAQRALARGGILDMLGPHAHDDAALLVALVRCV